jgi:DNA modification methylase
VASHDNPSPEFAVHNVDCVVGMRDLPSASVDLIVTSIPFADKYTYSSDTADVGNAQDSDDEFWTHMWFVNRELIRVLKPGRLLIHHIQDLRSYKGNHGFQGLRDVSGNLVYHTQEAGFWYASKWMIRKDPPTQMRRTNAQHLLYGQFKKNSLYCFPALPDYMLAFRAPGEPETPVRQTADLPTWQAWAESWWNDCVWDDVRMTDVLQNEKEGQDEKHICPMQLTVVRRVLQLYSNEGETVLDPFAGIGSVGVEAVSMKRKFIGYELKESYAGQASRNIRDAADSLNQLSLFPVQK